MATGSEYTEEQLNYYRICCITTDELTDALRSIFKQEWDNRYATTLGEWKDEAKNGQDFKNGESPRNQARNQELLATMINGNRAEWDCTMLFYAILFSDCIRRGLNAVVRSNVDDLRKFRNQDFAHLPQGHISKSKFQSAIAKVQSVFQALGLPTVKIQEISNQGNFPTSHLKKVLKEVDRLKQEVKVLEDQLQSETTPFCILPPKPSHDVAARNDEVANITKVLKQLKETNERRLSYLYISGNPGSAKSQLAGLVAKKIFMESTHAFVMTLNAANLDRLLDSYVSFARHLNCSEYAATNTLTDKGMKTQEKIAYIKSLAGTKVELYASWLLLVDNVVSIPEMYVHLPDPGNSHWSKGQLLITSQDTTSIPSDNSFIKQMSVSKGMAPSDATSLLATISGIADDETAKKVAHALDYQPLALASAATFVKLLCDNQPSSNVGWRDFLEKLDEGQLQNIETFLSNTNASYPYSMTTAIALAVEKSMSSDRVLKHGFNVISLCAPQPLNLDIVTNYVQKATENSDMNTEGEFKDKDVIGLRIRKSSLLLLEEDNGQSYIRIHLVVRHVIQRLIKQHWETQRFQAVHVVILSLNQFIVDRKTDEYTANGFRLLVPHLRFLSEQVEACFKENYLLEAIKSKIFNLKDYSGYFIAFGKICCVHFALQAAKRFASLVLELVSHDSMLDQVYEAGAHSLMGQVLLQMGTFEEGKRHFERSLARQLELLWSQHARVASSYNNLANVLKKKGDLKQAKEYHERALAIRQQTLGPQHPDVASSYNNLAHVLRKQGVLKLAKEYHKRALAIRQQTLGPQHPDIATSYENLAIVLGDQGDLKQAKEYHERALAILQQTLGPQHPDVATSYDNLAILLGGQGDLKQAKEYHECALAIRQQTLGPQHPDVATSYNNLGTVLFHQGDLKQAKEYHERALAVRQQTLGPLHPDVATCYDKLAIVLGGQGDLK
ncbi:Nephrocystin-3 [Acropora cervicornis]|uniref:Nephrocystin-3 n=1 Tax=Acropora cervicornis TaxID=6130 RepID=A0AAD9QRX8_ACRCE|nr:Nephrocystin-3 [Acropora cervicornis]